MQKQTAKNKNANTDGTKLRDIKKYLKQEQRETIEIMKSATLDNKLSFTK